ncbi:MAG: hypothetical protein M3R01_12770, partial [Actinomycetota bacterium]|nr:hypothetical protein [Actinomycetota bacterium]
MQPSSDRPAGSGRQLRRYGPLAAILVVLVVVAGVLVFTQGDDDDETATTGDTTTDAEAPSGVISYAQAEEDGQLDELTFPEGCDTERGTVAIPDFFAPPCYADAEDNGGETATGVTGDAIKVVAYIPLENDPVLGLIIGAVGIDDTGAETQATYEGYADLYNSYYQTYGRTVEVEFYQGTGTAIDEVAARADAQAVADKEPFAVWGGPVLTTAWADELANRGVVCLGCLGGGLPEW